MVFTTRKKSMTRNFACSLALSTTALLMAAVTVNAQEKDGPSKTERFLAQAQQICPVTGKDLTSMGGPIKAEVEGQTVFLCCRGCVGRPLNPKHWKTAQSNLRLARLALAQRVCPVTGKDLFSMGGPVKAKVGEETFFLCCKACFKGKIQQEHWDQVQANLIAAQGKCPVMGRPLPKDAKSTLVDGQRIFVCCPPCTEKVKADPEQSLAKLDKLLEENLARANRER